MSRTQTLASHVIASRLLNGPTVSFVSVPISQCNRPSPGCCIWSCWSRCDVSKASADHNNITNTHKQEVKKKSCFGAQVTDLRSELNLGVWLCFYTSQPFITTKSAWCNWGGGDGSGHGSVSPEVAFNLKIPYRKCL